MSLETLGGSTFAFGPALRHGQASPHNVFEEVFLFDGGLTNDVSYVNSSFYFFRFTLTGSARCRITMDVMIGK